MKKKVYTALISLIIIVTGIIGISRLRYWERSVWIFKVDTREPARGGFERGGRGNREFRTRPEDFEQNEQRRLERNNSSNQIDSMRIGRSGDSRNEPERFGNRPSREGGRHGHGHGAKVQLGKVGWFLAAFSFFALATIEIDKFFNYRKRKKL